MRRTIGNRPVAAISVALLIAGCASHQASTSADLGSDVHSVDAAGTRATAMIDLVHLPAGAAPVSAAPAGLARKKDLPDYGLPGFNEPRYWTVPVPPADVVDYLRSHPPAGLPPQGDPAAGELEFGSRDREGCLCNVLVIRVVPDGNNAAVRADAEVLWRRP